MTIPTQQAPHYGPPQAPRKKRRWPIVLVVVLAVFVGLVGSCTALVAGAANEAGKALESPLPTNIDQVSKAPSAEPSKAKPEKKPAAVAGIGTAARDGKFTFTVTRVKKNVKRVGSEMLGTKAQGRYVFVYVTVKNHGDEAQMFDASSQKLLDRAGREYSTDTEAGIYLEDSNAFLNEINPGNSVRGILVFDMPKNAKATEVELHDSPFSSGVTVSLK